MQMAGRLFWEVHPDGSVRTDGLHLEGFPRILWDALRSSGYPTPPTYEAMETVQLGVPRCRVQVSLPLHPNLPEWADLSTDMVNVQLLETLEVATLGVLNSFCTQHPDEVPTSLVGLLPTVDPEDPAWRQRMGHMADLLARMRPLDVLQEMVRREGALYRLQAFRSAASTAVTASAFDAARELGVRTHHLRSLSFGYMGLERDLVEARLRVGQLEAHEANWVAYDAQWVNILTDRLHAIVGLQEQMEQQREEMKQQREEMEQLKDERFVHLQELMDMEGQLEAIDQDMEEANELILMLQQPVPPSAPGAMEGDKDDAQSMVDDTEATLLDPMDEGSPAASAASGGDDAY
jgi:hypothetical protein